MKTIGLIGGTSWISTLDYYRSINQFVNDALGKSHSAKIILNSIDFEEYVNLSLNEDWDAVAKKFVHEIGKLERAGADCVLLGANTTHIVADAIIPHIRIPLIHIVEATATAIKSNNQSKVGLLGTRFTMEKPFYRNKMAEQQIEMVIPNEDDRSFIHKSIFDELGKGIFLPATKERYLRIIDDLISRGAEGIIYACTEIPLLIKNDECPVIAYNTIEIHSRAAVDFALR